VGQQGRDPGFLPSLGERAERRPPHLHDATLAVCGGTEPDFLEGAAPTSRQVICEKNGHNVASEKCLGPTVPLLKLVEEHSFSAKNKRHRAKLLSDDSLFEFVANHEAPALWVQLADLQQRYRYGGREAWTARRFESALRQRDADGVLVL
jgi:hypothetical protein